MGLLRKLAQIRERQILEHAEPFLEEGENVLSWIRVTRAGKSSRGFMFATDQRIVISWSKVAHDDNRAIAWDEIDAWGVAPDGAAGPVLALETEGDLHEAHILVGTEGMVVKANHFLVHFIDKVPHPRRPLSRVEDAGAYRATEVHVQREKKTVGKHTRRAIVTIIGIVLVVVGVVLLVAPGPGLLVTFAGLAVLASEYDWAQDILTWARQRYQTTRAKLKARRSTAD